MALNERDGAYYLSGRGWGSYVLSYPDALKDTAGYLLLSPFLRLSGREGCEDQIQVFLAPMSVSKLFLTP